MPVMPRKYEARKSAFQSEQTLCAAEDMREAWRASRTTECRARRGGATEIY
jgi:hypothetical protein